METITLSKSIRLLHDKGLLQIKRDFAENNLSKSALRYAQFDGQYYYWEWGKSAFIVVFELPKLFDFGFMEIMRYLIVYCHDYVVENNLTDDVLYPMFLENCNKTIVFDW